MEMPNEVVRRLAEMGYDPIRWQSVGQGGRCAIAVDRTDKSKMIFVILFDIKASIEILQSTHREFVEGEG